MNDEVKVGAPAGEQSTLSRELSDLLIQLSIGLHRYGMYPAGHPSLAPTVDNLLNHLGELLHRQGTLSLGVARSQLVIEGVATDPKNPVLADLAKRLHRHHLGAVTFRRGVGHEELHELLQMVAVDPDRSGEPIGLDPRIAEPFWEHVRLYPLTYNRLRLIAEDQPTDNTEETRGARTRAAQLWLGLARAAIAAEQAGEEPSGEEADQLEDADPSLVAKAIDSHTREDAYDQVIVGYMLQIAEELRSGRAAESSALKQRVSRMVGTLDRDTLAHLLEMGGDNAQRRQFLLNASEGMAVDAVVDLVQAASQTQGQSISHSMLRMLQKLSQHAEHARGRRARVAEVSVREQVARLIRDWSLNDPNPDQYRQALERMSTAAPVFRVAAEAQYVPEAERLVQMALELDVSGEVIERAIDALIERDRLSWLVEQASSAESPTAQKAVFDRIATPDLLQRVAAVDRIDTAVLDRQIEVLGIECVDPLVDALIAAESTRSRRILMERIVKQGREAGPALALRADDQRWYVRRNMLSLLSELPALPPGFDPMRFAQDAEPRVRREAFRILLREPESRERAICLALADGDDHNVRLGLTAASQGCPEAAVPLLISRASGGNNTDQRVTAIRVLAATGAPAALEALLAIATPRKSFIGFRAPSKTREYLATLHCLTQFDDPRAREVLARAAQSKDPDVARAALGRGGEPGA